jgi:hypothetical protein
MADDSGGASARQPGPRPGISSAVSTPERSDSLTPDVPPAAPRKRPVKLLLTAIGGDSWVEARSGSPTGPLLYSGTLAHGRELRLATQRIWLRLGAASNLSLAVNGRPAARELQGTVDVLVTAEGIRRV